MGRERPHSDTTECITRSDGAQDSQIHVFFEVPCSVRISVGSTRTKLMVNLAGSGLYAKNADRRAKAVGHVQAQPRMARYLSHRP